MSFSTQGGGVEPSRLTEQTQIQNIFFAKDTISELNKTILQNQILQNLPRESKQEIIDILIRNMKMVYKNLDISKINQSNIQSIHGQFKKISLEQTINDINAHTNYLKSPTDLKFQRDFTSNPNKGNKLMERPESTKSNQSVKQPILTNTKPGLNFNLNTNTNNLDDAFKPINTGLQIAPRDKSQGLSETTEHNVFNNYSIDKNIEDINTRMQIIQKSRDNELSSQQQRPTTPDFLKAKKTSIKQDEPINNVNTIINKNANTNTKTSVPDFKNMNSMQFNEGFNELLNDTSDNLYSLDNIDKLLVNTEIVIEDTGAFEDRLKRLQSERSNITAPKMQSNIDFTRPDFSSDSISQIPQREIPQREMPQQMQREMPQQMQREMPQQMQREIPQQMQREMPQQMQREIPQQMQREMPQQMQREIPQQMQREMQQQMQREIPQQMPQQIPQQNQKSNKIDELKTSMQTYNININDKQNSLTQKMQQYQDKISNLEAQNNELVELINKLENNSNELEKITQIKNQIATEFTELTIKNENIDALSSQLKLKEVQLNTKEATLNELIAKYDYLFKTEYIQFEVSNPENKSTYTWSLDLIKNIIGIKLMTYSIPLPRFNIEENKNNIFSFKLNEQEHSITLSTGKYTIDELITILNEKIKQINETLSININVEQKVIFESSNTEDTITIINTMLSKENLGFLVNTVDQNIAEKNIDQTVDQNIAKKNIDQTVDQNIKDNTKNHNIQIANKCWDLRIDNRVYLYLNNLSEEIPFGILYFNGNAVSQFKFEKPFNLTNLEIIFKDSYGMPYDFHNLPHSLTFLIEKIN